MTTIAKDANCVTLINVFTVEPEKQQQLLSLLTELTTNSMRHLPGFVSGSIHRSLDGTRVAIYGQWRTLADLKNMVRTRESIPQMQAALTLTSGTDAKVYEVVEDCNVEAEDRLRNLAWLGV